MRKLIIPIFLPEVACPGRCIFCDQRRISGQSEVVAPTAVAEIIKKHLATNPCPGEVEVEVAFFGGTFTAMPPIMQEEYLQAVQTFILRGEVGKIRVSTRPDRIEKKDMSRLRDYGVWLVELGIQSLNDRVLEKAERGYNRIQVEQAVRVIQEANLAFGAQLMPGLPESNTAIEIESTRTCAEWGAATARIYPTLVLKGTKLESWYQQDKYRPLSLEAAIEVCADMYQCFREYNIPVIRVGLQASDDLQQPGTVVAGPWHPALGELVQSRLWRRRLDQVIAEWQGESRLEVSVPIRQLSQAIGQHQANLSWLRHKYTADIRIIGSILLQSDQINVNNCD
ncbi:MAG: elongator complex protein 3 [Methanomassiliicoccales archaeon]